jgi:hypothetical protein
LSKCGTTITTIIITAIIITAAIIIIIIVGGTIITTATTTIITTAGIATITTTTATTIITGGTIIDGDGTQNTVDIRSEAGQSVGLFFVHQPLHCPRAICAPLPRPSTRRHRAPVFGGGSESVPHSTMGDLQRVANRAYACTMMRARGTPNSAAAAAMATSWSGAST